MCANPARRWALYTRAVCFPVGGEQVCHGCGLVLEEGLLQASNQADWLNTHNSSVFIDGEGHAVRPYALGSRRLQTTVDTRGTAAQAGGLRRVEQVGQTLGLSRDMVLQVSAVG